MQSTRWLWLAKWLANGKVYILKFRIRQASAAIGLFVKRFYSLIEIEKLWVVELKAPRDKKEKQFVVMSTASIFGQSLRKIRALRERIRAFTPYQKWNLIHYCGNIVLWLNGVNVMTDCRFYLRTLSPMAVVLLLTSIQFNTLWYYWNENKIIAIQPLATCVMVVQVSVCNSILPSS